MVEIKRLILLLLSIAALTPNSVAQSTLGTFAERQAVQLERRKALVAEQLSRATEAYTTTPCDSLERAIHELQKQEKAINEAIVRITQQMKTEAEAAELLAQQQTTPTTDTLKQEEPSATTSQEDEPNVEEDAMKNLTDSLRNLFSTTSRRYALIEQEISELFENYTAEYDKAKAGSMAYDSAKNVKKAEEGYTAYTTATEAACTIADEIADRSDRLINSKLGSFFSIADALGADSLRGKYAEIIDSTEEIMLSKLQGACNDIDLAMYPHRLKCTILLEQEIATTLSPEREKELATLLDNYDTTYAIFSKIKEPKRANAKFSGVEIVKKQSHKAVSSLPTIKAPASGEIYSIMVANYASLPPSTEPFRNATPLYREVRGDGRTYIYIGLYPTALSAEEDIALLREVGFKQPSLVMWRNGIRRDDFQTKDTASATKKSPRYRIEIHGVDAALSSEVLSAIRSSAPRKELSKFNDESNKPVYTLGTFTKEDEAKSVASAITAADSSLSTIVVEFGK